MTCVRATAEVVLLRFGELSSSASAVGGYKLYLLYIHSTYYMVIWMWNEILLIPISIQYLYQYRFVETRWVL